MPVAIIVGAAVTLLGVLSVVFVMRHKRVEKNSMYSARRSQIEHKVRAARQRTLAPHGHAEKPAQAPPPEPAGSSIFAPAPRAPTITYEPSAFEPPPAAPPQAPAKSGWDVGPAAPQPSAFGFPATEAPPSYAPPPAPPPAPEPIETPRPPPPPEPPAWTPAPAETLPPVEPARAATPAGAGAAWSIIDESKASAAVGEGVSKKKAKDKDKDRERVQSGAWSVASGEMPGEEDEQEFKPPSAAVAIAQYAVLVVGLVMVLIGVLVMVANSHVT